MKFYLISRSDWRFLARDLGQQLLARWPEASLHEEEPESINCLGFELPMQHSTLAGSLNREGTAVAFFGDIRDVAGFVLWVRSLVPPAEPLFFCDDAMSGSLDIKPDTTQAELFQLYDYSPPPPGWLNYYVTARPAWSLSPRDFARLLLLRWPTAKVEVLPESDSHRSVTFKLLLAHSEVTGSLKRRVPAPIFTGDMRDCAEFALWCRSVVPATELSLAWDGGSVPLEPETTGEDILRALGASAAH